MIQIETPRNYVRKKEKTWSEFQLKIALREVENGTSVYKAAKMFKIPYETLRGKVTLLHPNSHGRPPVMTPDEEEQIAYAFIYLAEVGAPCGRRQLRDIVKSYLDNIGQDSRFKNNRPGKDWIIKFEKRMSHILTRRKPEVLTTSRARGLTENVVKTFFDMWEKMLDENNLRDKGQEYRIFNCDETGLNTNRIGDKMYAKKGVRDTYIQAPSSGKTMYTVLFCASASGHYMPPLVVYKAKTFEQEWGIGGPRNAAYTVSESGYMHDTNFGEWFTKVFVKETATYQKPVVLIFDGHNSHLTYKTVKSAIDNNIILLCLPPHTSHALQPLDVSVFRSVKSNWTNIVDQILTESIYFFKVHYFI